MGAVGALTVAVDRDALIAWVEASCHRQGVPVFVSDPGVLTRTRATHDANERLRLKIS